MAPTDSKGSPNGDAKREEVRRLIVRGKPHKGVVRLTKVLGGTVSLMRQEMREAIPIYRNSESGLSVPAARRKRKDLSSKPPQSIERIGGGGSPMPTSLLDFRGNTGKKFRNERKTDIMTGLAQ